MRERASNDCSATSQVRTIGQSWSRPPKTIPPMRLLASVGNRAISRLRPGSWDADGAASGRVAGPLARVLAGNGGALPFLERIQSAFGAYDLGMVRAHTGPCIAEAVKDMEADAFTVGHHIAFGIRPDIRLAAHEAAHAVQQGCGVATDQPRGRPEARNERHADQVADAVVHGRSAEELIAALCGPPRPLVWPPGSEVIQRQTSVRAELTGHASPLWHNADPRSAAANNLRLSEERVEEVQRYFQEILGRALYELGLSPEFVFESRGTTTGQFAPSLSSEARGSSDTLAEAGGDLRANRLAMRRVDLRVTFTWHVTDVGMATSRETETAMVPASNRWAIKLTMSGGAGHAGAGVALAAGTLMNLGGVTPSPETARVSFVGGGAGMGLSTPGVDPGGWSDFEEFTTNRPCTFDDFDGLFARLTSMGIGAGVGYTFAYISFPTLGANSISVGGPNVLAVGADVSTNVGTLAIVGPKPSNTYCISGRTETREVTEYHESQREVPNTFSHTVLFDTDSAAISDAELERLAHWVATIMRSYSPPMQSQTGSDD